MTVTKSIPADQLRGLDVQLGDTLRVLKLQEENVIVEIRRADIAPTPVTDKVSEWLLTAVGSVKLAPHETVDDVRMAYYVEKYGLET